MSFDRDLELWETGAISVDDLVRSHPGEDVDGLLALHERMLAAAAGPVSLDEDALQGFLKSLPDRARPRRRHRSLLLAVAAVLLTASKAVAVPAVHDGVPAVTHGVGRLLGIGSPPATGPAPSEAPATPPPGDDTTAVQPGGSDGSSDADDHSSGGRDGGSGGEGDQGQDQQSDVGSGGEGDQGSDQQGDGNSGGSGDQGSESSGSSSGSGSDSGGDQGDGSGGDGQSSSSDGGAQQ